ncbi:MAG TPA: phosphate propanoyltransferase [Phycisphaerae bacterium]|jgi:putative phosphotransacetylase|nr:phosphate propanoyltransferase [Phycisphaerae bacterium]HOJ56282.1 phosphate propanoyltransferase [Phycisphaerae bacterium]HOL28126.1 phosphate propanoyltransferase [Phycisphaerae bacterium]HPP19763.1 phosphate propanoyltransferase [Phycisphaerae bacterium]HPU33815.1 phosphate propanoyltransferase [Phycisphaerae bacterium]
MSVMTRGGLLDRSAVERVVREVVRHRLNGRIQVAGAYKPKLLVNISARHMHITQENLEILFGPGAKLTPYRMLYQDGQFASEQTVTIIGPRHRTITNLRILGPCRTLNQIELSFTDGIAMGIDLPVRMSGDIKGTPGCIVLGPKGYIELKEGVIRAMRHVHMNPREAEYYGVKSGDHMLLKVDSSCPMTFGNVVARVDPALKLEVHIDTDEGNACDLTNARKVELLKA